MSNTERHNTYVQMQYSHLTGKTVSGVRAMTIEELEQMYWSEHEVGVVIEFTDGTFIVLMKDDEGNGAGAGLIGAYNEPSDATARQIVFA